MIILDTNVLSALMQSKPDRKVIEWIDAQAAESVWITSVTLFEVRYGLALLPAGKKRKTLEASFERLLEEDLENRILPFDTSAAQEAGLLAAKRQRLGKPVDMRDTQIAGIALARRASVATRNFKHFEDLDVAVFNPWA